MGNRAHVIFTDGQDISPAVYLHWNGGPESVYPFLRELNRRGVRVDTVYQPARFCQVVGEFFTADIGGKFGQSGDSSSYGLSLGVTNGPKAITVEDLEPFDHGDNGVYVVNPDQSVRRFSRGREWTQDEVDAERAAADAMPHYNGIAEMFAALDAWRREQNAVAAS